MSDKNQRGDFYSGIPWVYVTRAQAWAHPKGQLGVVLWGIGAFFIAVAIFKVYVIMNSGGDWWVAALTGALPLLTGVGILLRVPWAIYLAVVSAGLTVYGLIRGFGQETSVFYMAETVAYIGIVFYLIDGDRPNLIYRYRYRKYSAGNDGTSDD